MASLDDATKGHRSDAIRGNGPVAQRQTLDPPHPHYLSPYDPEGGVSKVMRITA